MSSAYLPDLPNPRILRSLVLWVGVVVRLLVIAQMPLAALAPLAGLLVEGESVSVFSLAVSAGLGLLLLVFLRSWLKLYLFHRAGRGTGRTFSFALRHCPSYSRLYVTLFYVLAVPLTIAGVALQWL